MYQKYLEYRFYASVAVANRPFPQPWKGGVMSYSEWLCMNGWPTVLEEVGSKEDWHATRASLGAK